MSNLDTFSNPLVKSHRGDEMFIMFVKQRCFLSGVRFMMVEHQGYFSVVFFYPIVSLFTRHSRDTVESISQAQSSLERAI